MPVMQVHLITRMRFTVLFVLSLATLGQAGSPEYFVPSHRISGIGVARDDISDDLLAARTDLMIQSQTFSIMREPLAVAGAQAHHHRTPNCSGCSRRPSSRAACPPSLIEAIAYLESWGDARAESPAGPKGIMQISAATARSMGLKVRRRDPLQGDARHVSWSPARARRRRYKTVTHRTPYMVTVRDERLFPERAIPAAARYLAGMEQKFGGRDWAIFAYHCGQGCVGEMQDLTRRARGIPKDQLTVPRMFFSTARRGIASCTRRSSSRCSATGRPPIASASCARSNCWRCTAAIRTAFASPGAAVSQRVSPAAPARSASPLGLAEARRPGVPQLRRYPRGHRQAAGEGAGPPGLLRLHAARLARYPGRPGVLLAGVSFGTRRAGVYRVRNPPPVRAR